jgi:hypothetical protein
VGKGSPASREGKPPAIPFYELLTQNNTTLLYWPLAMVVSMNQKTTAPSLGYLATTRKSYGNAKASHEVIQCNPTELNGMVASFPFVSDTLPSLPEIQTSDDQSINSYYDYYYSLLTNRKNLTLGILTHQVGTRNLITM